MLTRADGIVPTPMWEVHEQLDAARRLADAEAERAHRATERADRLAARLRALGVPDDEPGGDR